MLKIKLLIADDHTILREGIGAILKSQHDMEVVAEATNGREAVDLAKKHDPDIVLMDVAMPSMGGLEALMEIKNCGLRAKVLVLTQYDNPEYVYRFLKAGASGYILKKAAGTELVNAIRSVYLGHSFLHPEVATSVIQDYLHGKQKDMEADPYEHLSDREKQILTLIAEGHSNQEIGNMLFISVKTVMGHRTHLMDKLDLHSRTELVKFAVRHGLIQL